MASRYLTLFTCLILFHSLDAAVKRPFGPRNLAAHVQHYLDNGGQEKLRKAFRLGPNVYYNPLHMFEREDMDPSQTKSRDYASDLDLLRAMSLHVPGVDSLEQIAQVRQDDEDCSMIGMTGVIGAASNFSIAYSSNTPANVRAPVRFAVGKWADKFESSVPIRICFKWANDLGGSTLGAATSPSFVSGGSLQGEASYSPSLASAMQGVDVLPPRAFHVTMVLNLRVRWHLDFGRRAPFDRFDLATTVLHELTHGLFFSGTIKGNRNTREANFNSNRPGRFDQFMTVEGNIPVARVCGQNETNLFNAITNPSLRFVDRGSGANFALFAPGLFQEGSSTYHFDNVTLESDCGSGNIDRRQCSDLMTHQLNVGYTQREIGETTSRVLRAMVGEAVGVVGNANCDLPESPLTSGNAQGNSFTAFTLPTWGIATVAVVAGVGAILVAGVVFSSIAARRRGGTG